jgi:hypothetical protein
MTRGVYAIVHKPSGWAYIGCSENVQHRWRSHRLQLKAGRHHSPALQAAWDRDGAAAFECKLLEPVPAPFQMVPRENAHMRLFVGRLFNAMPENRHGPESKAAMSESQLEAWDERHATGNDKASLETKQKISRGTRQWARRPSVRRQKSRIARETLAAANFRTPEALRKNAEALRGTPKTPAHRAAMKLKHSSGTCKCHPKREENNE